MRKETAVIAIVVAIAAGFFAGTFTRGPREAVSAAAVPDRGGPAAPATVGEAAAPGAADRRPAATKTRPPAGRESPDAVYKVPVARGEPSRGADDALVTIVEWTDFQCPFCGRVQATLRQLEERYGDRVRLVVRMNPLPFHDQAMPAAEAAMAAHAQGQFWRMHDALFESQATLGRETYERIAQQLGLDMTRFRQDLDRHTHREAIEAQQRAGAALGARGTPTFFVNGKKLRGAQPLERFQAAVDAALVTAQAAMRERHLRSAQVYDFLIRDGATAPVLLAGAARGDGEGGPDPDRVYTIARSPRVPRKGGRDARVVIQQFSDFQCPFCGRVEPTIAALLERNGDRVAVEWRNFPLPMHDDAMPAAEAAMEAHAQGKFWPMHALLFENQRALARADLERYARQVGLDLGRFRAALDQHTHRAAIEADIAASRASGARHGTPAFFIGGRLVQGAQPLEAFQAAVDRALAGGASAPSRAGLLPRAARPLEVAP